MRVIKINEVVEVDVVDGVTVVHEVDELIYKWAYILKNGYSIQIWYKQTEILSIRHN